jgi:ubiquinone/menaquinone biosynthesis C-methylase UbiE
MERQAYDEIYQLEATHWWYRGMRNITAQLLKPVMQGQDNLILDAGCGIGGNLEALAAFGKVVGFDYSHIALDYASEKHTGKLLRATVEALPYADDTFDLVTSFDVLYCREVADDVRALCEFGRVVRTGGYVLVRLPAMPALRGSHDTVVHGIRRYVADELREKMLCAWLKPLRITYANSLLLPLIFVIRKWQEHKVRQGTAPDSDVSAVSEPLNTLLEKVLSVEALWIKAGHSFPAGVSIFCLAQKV